jgi:hypothetical protein
MWLLPYPLKLRPHHFMRRIAPDRIVTSAEAYRFLKPGELLSGGGDARFAQAWAMARADSFAPAAEAAPAAVARAAE